MTANKMGNKECHTSLQKDTKMTKIKLKKEETTYCYYQICKMICMQLFYNQIYNQ